jgi:protein-glutamine gamma-glutamyltransferase
MTRSGASAIHLADRYYQFSLLGLMATGFLALVGSGSLQARTAILAGLGAASAFLLLRKLAAKSDWVYASIQILACLELVAAALLSVNLSFFLYLAAFLLFLVTSLAAGEIRRSTRGGMLIARGGLRRFYARLGGLTLSIAFGILALTTALFFVLPRTADAALSRLVAERYHLPGFSGEVRLGQIGQILNRSTPVMHVRMVGAEPREFLKWRGTALSRFDGKRWSAPRVARRAVLLENGRSILATDDQRRRPGSRITYEVLLETISSDVLFFAGAPEVLWVGSPAVFQAGEGAVRLGETPRRRLRYGAVSYLGALSAEAGRVHLPARDDYLQLPVLDRRIGELARQVTAHETSDEARALAIENYLRNNLGYTSELPSRESPDPLAEFLYQRRKGHCEYFASSMAVMLRTLGIPSRLVIGFQGGVLNPITGWHVVRASDAHSWVEAWIEGHGWTTFDPTPPGPRPREGALWSRISFYSDAAEMFWQEWVVGYDFSRQLALATRMHTSGRVFGSRWLGGVRWGWQRWQAAALRAVRAYGSVALAVLLLVGLAWVATPRAWKWWQARRRLDSARRGGAIASDATLLYNRMSNLLKRRGHSKPAWITPGEFARGLPPSEAAELVASFTTAYHDLRYGGRAEAAARMIALLGSLEHATLPPRT